MTLRERVSGAFRPLIRRVGFRNYQVLKFGGLLPGRTSLQEEVAARKEYIPVNAGVHLDSYIEAGTPRILVTYVGIGSRGGFLLPAVEDGERSVLPDGWWRSDNQDVFLFSFACYSAEYIEAGNIRNFLQGALCYKGEVWVAVDAGRYWMWLIGRLEKVIRRRGGIGERIFEDALDEYLSAIRGKATPRGGGKPAYLVRVSLVRQIQQLCLLSGGGV